MERVQLQTEKSELILNLKLGAQIEKLKLLKQEVIESFDQSIPFFLTGNFLMFPWVNRIKNKEIPISGKSILIEPLSIDLNNFPIHGLYYNKERKVVELKKNSVTLIPITIEKNFPEFRETFQITENEFILKTEFYNSSNETQFFSFGYHPYLKLNEKIDNLFMNTNCKEFITLTEELIPKEPLQFNPISKILNSSLKEIQLDNLFINRENSSENFFEIFNSFKKLKISFSNSNNLYKYFQIYTPETRNSIAIEPMSSTGNSFFNSESNLVSIESGETKNAEFKIQLIL